MSPNPPPDIQRYLRQSRRLSRSDAGTFHHAFYLFPRHQRDALHVIYRFCRLVDDAVDSDHSPSEKKNRLERLSKKLHGEGTGEPWVPLEWIRGRYDIPIVYFEDLIEGARSDIGTVRMPDYAALRDYCYQVAGTVGLMTLHVMGFKDQSAIPYSLAMGRAFQLTNILRDVDEDRSLGRCYLPQTILNRHDAVSDWENGQYTDRLTAALSELGQRARLNYRQCLPLFERVTPQSKLPLALMTAAYSWYLSQLEHLDYNPSRDSLSLPKKSLPKLLWKSWLASRGRTEQCLMIS